MNKKNEILVNYLTKSSARFMGAMRKNPADKSKNTAKIFFNGKGYLFPLSLVMGLSMETGLARMPSDIEDCICFIVIPSHGFKRCACGEFLKNLSYEKIEPNTLDSAPDYWFYTEKTISKILFNR